MASKWRFAIADKGWAFSGYTAYASPNSSSPFGDAVFMQAFGENAWWVNLDSLVGDSMSLDYVAGPFSYRLLKRFMLPDH